MFSMVDAHSTNVLQTLILLGVYILKTTASFFACSINPEKNIFFSSLWCLTIQNEVGACSGCHGYNTCFRARQSMLTRSTQAQWAHWYPRFRLQALSFRLTHRQGAPWR